jgi:hypothetical protein
MTGDPGRDFYEPPPRVYGVTRVRPTPIVAVLIMLVGTLVGGYYLARQAGWLTPVERGQTGWQGDGAGIKSGVTYPVEPQPVRAVNGEDPIKELRRWLDQKFALLEARVLALENQAKQKPPQAQAPAPMKQEAAKPPPKPHRPMLYVKNTVEPKPEEALYDLAPAATKIPCVVETSMSSDTGETFTAKSRGGVYDTKTGHHLLIPQGSTLLGEYAGASLVFGNERLPTMALSLSLPDGRSVDLGNAPVMNQEGMAGLVSRVDQHWWRLIGATLVLGALRGGQQAVYTVLNPGDTAGAIASGLGSSVGQVGQSKIGRALDTRPTIYVEAGTLCNVVLTKPLKLAAYTAQP